MQTARPKYQVCRILALFSQSIKAAAPSWSSAYLHELCPRDLASQRITRSYQKKKPSRSPALYGHALGVVLR